MPLNHRMALLRSRHAKLASRPLNGGHVPPGAKHLWCYSFYKYLLVGQPLPPSATRLNTLLVFLDIAWRSNTTARHYTSTCAILVFKHLEQNKINPTLIIMHIHNQVLK